jgi:hypothetical protein
MAGIELLDDALLAKLADPPELDGRANQLHGNCLLDIVLEASKVGGMDNAQQAGEDCVGIAVDTNKEAKRSNLDVGATREFARFVA